MRGKAVSLSLLILGDLLVALALQNSDLLWATIPLFSYLLFGLALTPEARPRLAVERRPALVSADNKSVIEMALIVRNEGRQRLYFLLEEIQPHGTVLESGSLTQALSLGAGEEMTATYSLSATRGYFSWQTASITASDLFGVVALQWAWEAKGEIRIEPQVGRYRPLPLHPHQTLASPGAVPTRSGGSGVDYWGTRDYQSGDPLKRLDWRHSNRRPHQFFTKDFVLEKTACLALVLDARESSEVKRDQVGLFDHCTKAVGSLAEVFLKQGHRVSLFVHGGQSDPVFPDFGKKQLRRILGRLSELRPESNTRESNLVHLALPTLSRKTFLVVVSPLQPEDHQFFVRMRALGYQMLLICPDSLDFAAPNPPPAVDHDLLSLRAAKLERRVQLGLIEQLAVPVIDWRTCEPLQGVLRQALRHSSRWRMG